MIYDPFELNVKKIALVKNTVVLTTTTRNKIKYT